MKHRAKLGLLALPLTLALALGVGGTTPAGATPPQAHEVWDGVIVPDWDNGLAVFVNLTRDDFCDWLAAGAPGEPPLITSLIDWHHETGPDRELTGVVGQGTLPIELWRLDDGPLGGPCDSTDESTEPFAVGEAYAQWNVMRAAAEPDIFRARGTVVDADGTEYRYHVRAMGTIDAQGVLRMIDRSGLLVPLR